jgi:hypothetical protein
VPTTSIGYPSTNENKKESPAHKHQRVGDTVAGLSCLHLPKSPEAPYPLNRPRHYSGVVIVSYNANTTIGSPQEATEYRVILLQAIHKSEDRWYGVVKGGDPDNVFTQADVIEIQLW